MLSLVELWYRAKKLYSIYPGVVAPVSGGFLADHYARRRSERGPVRALVDSIAGAAFLGWVPWRARMVRRRFGLDPRWTERAVAIARARFADPNDIALFRISDAAELDGYIRRFEDAGLNKRINPLAWTPDCVLADKIRFYERCAAHGLRHPRVIATVRDGRIAVVEPANGRPLLSKPARGEGGRGVRILPVAAPDDPDAFRDWLTAQLGRIRQPWLVQERVATHGALADLALNALPTARITTILDERAVPEVVNAVLRIPSDPIAQVDNMKAGGLLSPIDLAAGTLGLACKGYGGGDYAEHPVTGAAIPDRRLPDWPEAKALVMDAHRRGFGEYALIGWDVGFAPDGPILIEGNGKPGVLMPQRAGRRGLGAQRYGELLAHQLAQRAT
jgi:hypothetical protein